MQEIQQLSEAHWRRGLDFSICSSDSLYSLVNRGLDSLPLGAEAFALLPAHLHEHSETEILHRQFELFVFRVVRVSTFLHAKRNKLLHSGYQAKRTFSFPNILFQCVSSMRLDTSGLDSSWLCKESYEHNSLRTANKTQFVTIS